MPIHLSPSLTLSVSDCEVDPKLMGSQLLLSTLLQNTVSGSGGPAGLILQSDGPYDFYRDPNMSQARLCLPALEQLSKAVRQRLDDWPDHPALVQVTGIQVLKWQWFVAVSSV